MSLHGLGHPSYRATKRLIDSRFVWHGMNIDVANWCHSCKGCQTAKVARHNKLAVDKVNEPKERFEHVHVKILSPLPYSAGIKYLLTCVNCFTRWPELWDNLCKQFGIVRNLTTRYHPQSNGMVERFHRQLRAAIMAHKSPNP